MPDQILGIEWLNANAGRSYPLSDMATAIDESAEFELPNDFLVSLYLPIPASVDTLPDKFFLRSVANQPFAVTISVAYDDGSNNPPIVAVATIPAATHRENASYALIGVDEFDDVVGRVAVGLLTSIAEQPAGQFFFAPEGGYLDPDCIRPTLRGVASLRVVTPTGTSEKLVGDIELVAGANQRISVATASGVTQIRFDAIAGEGLTENCDCDDVGGNASQHGAKYRAINGVRPGTDRNYVMLGDPCIKLEAVEGGMKITNTCTAPCLGCSDLAPLFNDLKLLKNSEQTLLSVQRALQQTVFSLRDNLFGGLLSDRNCETC